MRQREQRNRPSQRNDDEEPVRDFLAQMLADAGHRTLQAVHGAEALDLVA